METLQVGMKLTVEREIVEAMTTQVGECDHDRFIVDLDKYLAKLKKKIEG